MRMFFIEFNVFEGIWTNWLFGGVIFITILGQVIIVEFGGAGTENRLVTSG